MIDLGALQIVLCALAGWLDRQEREVVAYLIEENRLLRRQLAGRRLRLTDDDRRRLAARAYRLGRAALRDIATIATPDTLLRPSGGSLRSSRNTRTWAQVLELFDVDQHKSLRRIVLNWDDVDEVNRDTALLKGMPTVADLLEIAKRRLRSCR